MSGERLDEIVPMQTSGRGGEDDGSSLPTTQYAMDPVEELGLLKIDFLGLINLTILAKTRELIRETRGIDVDHRALPLDDLKTYELLSRGETGGVFQLEGAGMTRYIKELEAGAVRRDRVDDRAVPSGADGPHRRVYRRKAWPRSRGAPP